MTHIFISYSRKDSDIIDGIVTRLARDGFKAWIDREEIKGGELWREAIVEAVDHASCFVLMLSPDSIASDNVRREVDLAEGAGKSLVPVLLKPLKLPAKLRYQLAGIQWIEYFRDPELKYNELVRIVRSHQPISDANAKPNMREGEIVIGGIKLSKFGSEQQEKLLDIICEVTDTSRSDISITRVNSGSVHAFVNLPSDSAYRLKTAALNRNLSLVRFGVDAFRLIGDRHFVLLKTGAIGPLRIPKARFPKWFIGGLVLVTAFLGSTLPEPQDPSSLSTPILPSSTIETVGPTASNVSTATNTSTNTPTLTPIIVTTPNQACSPTLIALENANCRIGPSRSLEVYGTLLQGDATSIIGMNESGTWFLVDHPQSFRNPCWIYNGAAVQVEGILECINVIRLPTLPSSSTPRVEPSPATCETPQPCPKDYYWNFNSCVCEIVILH